MSFACVLHFAMSSSAFHIMSSCASHSHTCSSYASEHFPRCPFLQSGATTSSGVPFYLFSCAGIKHSRNGPRFVKRPWYSTGRPPVKFRVNRRSFDTPTVNRVTVKASCVLQPKTPPKQPNNPSKTLPCPSPFYHDRVGENRTPFGAS